jgi:hypothetical protein
VADCQKILVLGVNACDFYAISRFPREHALYIGSVAQKLEGGGRFDTPEFFTSESLVSSGLSAGLAK